MIQIQLYETAEVKLVTIFSTFDECKENNKLYKNGFFSFLTFIWENFVYLWIQENSEDKIFKTLCSAYAESLLWIQQQPKTH